jgi:hypothetical protein
VEYVDGSFDNPFLGREKDNIFPVPANNHDVPYPPALTGAGQEVHYTLMQNRADSGARCSLACAQLPSGTKGTHGPTCIQNAPIYNTNLTPDQNGILSTSVARPDFQTIYRWMRLN